MPSPRPPPDPNAPVQLRLCEASGRNGWLARYVAPGQALPTYPVLKSRAYDGEFPSLVIGKNRCVSERDVPHLLATFELIPLSHGVEEQAEAAEAAA